MVSEGWSFIRGPLSSSLFLSQVPTHARTPSAVTCVCCHLNPPAIPVPVRSACGWMTLFTTVEKVKSFTSVGKVKSVTIVFIHHCRKGRSFTTSGQIKSFTIAGKVKSVIVVFIHHCRKGEITQHFRIGNIIHHCRKGKISHRCFYPSQQER